MKLTSDEINERTKENMVVIYHANCTDGFCAAWLYWLCGEEATFVPASYGDAPPYVVGKHVLILDFSYPRETLLKMHDDAKSIVVLDHHKTAEADLADLPFCVFDSTKSGARLTLEYLSDALGKGMSDQIYWLVDYVEDRDLWKWKMKHSKEFSAGLRLYNMDFKTWDSLFIDYPLPGRRGESLINSGDVILRSQAQMVQQHVRNAVEVTLNGHRVLSCNATVLQSEIGHELAKNRPFSVTWFVKDGRRIYSLRSTEGGVDVSEIAKDYGGGGHKHAAGFTVPFEGAM